MTVAVIIAFMWKIKNQVQFRIYGTVMLYVWETWVSHLEGRTWIKDVWEQVAANTGICMQEVGMDAVMEKTSWRGASSFALFTVY